MRSLYVDPGEDTGWTVAENGTFIESGTEKMWEFSDAVWDAALIQQGFTKPEWDVTGLHEVTMLLTDGEGCGRLVLENWTLYPWVINTGAMDWDECRTARLIGSLFAVCRFADWEYVQQGAKIKEAALAAGAEQFFRHPLHENRHANDSCLHYWYDVVRHGKSET